MFVAKGLHDEDDYFPLAEKIARNASRRAFPESLCKKLADKGVSVSDFRPFCHFFNVRKLANSLQNSERQSKCMSTLLSFNLITNSIFLVVEMLKFIGLLLEKEGNQFVNVKVLERPVKKQKTK